MAWVLQHADTQLSIGVIGTAAARGHTDLCKYLRAQQCPWGEQSTTTATAGGHVDLLTWLVSNGCPWNARQLCLCAAEGTSIEMLLHLQQQGLMTDAAVLSDMLAQALAFSKFATAKWLRQQGADWKF